MAIELVFETHPTTQDNEQGRATGWLPGRLSEQGRGQARRLGQRRSGDRIAAVFSSDLARAVETASVAFGETTIPWTTSSTASPLKTWLTGTSPGRKVGNTCSAKESST